MDRLSSWLITEVPRLLPQHLRRQRWFAGKSETIDEVRLDDLVWVAEDPDPVAVVLAALRYAAAGAGPARTDLYALLVGVTREPGASPVLASLPWDATRQVVDASTRGAAVLALLRSVTKGGAKTGVHGGTLEFIDASVALERTLGGEISIADMAPLCQEQSNTSIRIQRSHVAKLFRRIQDGENPQLEVGRFLSRDQGFRGAPRLDGALRYQRTGGESATLGVVEEWVANRGDGWSYVLDRLAEGSRPGGSLERLAADLFELGATTANLHLALASDPTSDAFAPEVVTAGDVDAWTTGLTASAMHVLGLVERHHARWEPGVAALGRRLLDHRVGLLDRLHLAPLESGEVIHRIRIHGDYHLGQTLRVERGFIIIDFEGEPSRPLNERRSKQCVLKDVAGMLRSFDYAVETVHRASPSNPPADLSRLRAAYLDGYWGRALVSPAALLPPDRLRENWTAAFELEKSLYEIGYELDHRPEWLPIPLHGALRLIGAEL